MSKQQRIIAMPRRKRQHMSVIERPYEFSDKQSNRQSCASPTLKAVHEELMNLLDELESEISK